MLMHFSIIAACHQPGLVASDNNIINMNCFGIFLNIALYILIYHVLVSIYSIFIYSHRDSAISRRYAEFFDDEPVEHPKKSWAMCSNCDSG